MPYVRKALRVNVDALIDELLYILGQHNLMASCGILNYCISRLVGGLFLSDPSYGRIALFTGVLENVKQEFYRRAAAPYEDGAIERNGDIPEYGAELT